MPPRRTMPVQALLMAVAAATSLLLAAGAHGEIVELTVTGNADSGKGTLRAALDTALADPGRQYRITFGDRDGPFSTPQTIELNAPLPPVRGDVTIDGFIDNLLWKSYGVTVSGTGRHAIFEVLPGATLKLTGITLRDGAADSGGAIVNHGRLIVEGVSLFDNFATEAGGAIVNFGRADIINSTFAGNRAANGGALAGLDGVLRVIHATVHDNAAESGAAVWSAAELLLANSILSGSSAQQCFNTGPLSPASTHNLIQGGHDGCGDAMLTSDPRLGAPGYYNGPTLTMPLKGTSPAVHMGLAGIAVNADGERLKWDQRGNGDPRSAGGYPDLGAFERQTRLPDEFVVDMTGDNGLRGCTRVGNSNCPLRAALELAAAARNPTPVRFSGEVFFEPQVLTLPALPEGHETPVVIDGAGAAPIEIRVPGPVPWRAINGVTIGIAEPNQKGQSR